MGVNFIARPYVGLKFRQNVDKFWLAKEPTTSRRSARAVKIYKSQNLQKSRGKILTKQSGKEAVADGAPGVCEE